jgi:hypothetical protein
MCISARNRQGVRQFRRQMCQTDTIFREPELCRERLNLIKGQHLERQASFFSILAHKLLIADWHPVRSLDWLG